MNNIDVCLFGTSNGVFDNGYASAIKSATSVDFFQNMSLGYSTSALFCMRAAEVDISSFDICILDFAVNDAVTLAAGAQDVRSVESALEDCVRSVLSARSIPAILVLPVFSIYASNNRIISDIYRRVAEKYAVPYFDIYAYLDFIGKNYASIESLFEDDMHLNREFACDIGRIFIGILLDYICVEPKLDETGIYQSGYKYGFRKVSSLEFDGKEISCRGTSLYRCDISEIPNDTCLKISIDGEVEVVALGVDWAQSVGELSVHGLNKAVLSLSNHYARMPDKPFIYGVHPIMPPVRSDGGQVTLRLAHETEGARLAIGGIVVRRMEHFAVRRPFRRAFPIADTVVNPLKAGHQRSLTRWKRGERYYDSVRDFHHRTDTPSGIYTIKMFDAFFDFLIENRNVETTIVSFHPAMPGREQYSLPIFAGLGISGECANVILVSDPALYLDENLALAWYAGFKGRPVQPALTHLIREFHRALGGKRLIFTGPSGGGFAAMFYSWHFPGSICFPTNPQTNISRYELAAVELYTERCFSSTPDQIVSIPVISDLRVLYGESVQNYIIYSQNGSDDHLELHWKPFSEGLPPSSVERVRTIIGNWGEGHTAPPAELMTRLLASAVNWSGDWGDFLAEADLGYLGEDVR